MTLAPPTAAVDDTLKHLTDDRAAALLVGNTRRAAELLTHIDQALDRRLQVTRRTP